ncbi:YvrJ family protein (plasmid) [Limosilactobacillus fermentum]|uniref:YvrJ family protein n=1 Tax=Limosilactobacillus fermentum TaxID=1613 RepID=UPI0033136A1E
MENEILKYLAEQASGVVIAIFLILRVETKLDDLTGAIIRLTESLTKEVARGRPR